MRNACHWWLFTLLLVQILSIPAVAQTCPQQDSRIFRTEPMGNGYARTGVNTAIFRGSSLVTSESRQPTTIATVTACENVRSSAVSPG